MQKRIPVGVFNSTGYRGTHSTLQRHLVSTLATHSENIMVTVSTHSHAASTVAFMGMYIDNKLLVALQDAVQPRCGMFGHYALNG